MANGAGGGLVFCVIIVGLLIFGFVCCMIICCCAIYAEVLGSGSQAVDWTFTYLDQLFSSFTSS